MKRVLVIPSWYPSQGSPHTGVFFQEQAALAALDFDVRVLVLAPLPVPRRQTGSWVKLKISGPRLIPSTAPVIDEFPTTWRWAVPYAAPLTNPLHHPAIIPQLAGQFASSPWRPDLVHAQSAFPGGQIAKPLAAALGISYVITEHQHLIFDYFSNALWRHALDIYHQAAGVAVVSEFQRHMMLMNGVNCPMRVIGNLVDDSRFVLPPESSSDSLPNVLFVGSTSRLKDHTTFFNAIATLKATFHRPFTVTVVSPDFQKGGNLQLTQAIRDQGLQDFVQFISSADRNHVVQLIHRCSVFVSTSIAETFGVAVCEALMCGKPAVVTASGGVSDFVIHGQNGFIAQIGDANAIADYIRTVFDQPTLESPESIRNSVIGKYGCKAFRTTLNAFYLSQPGTVHTPLTA